MTLGNVEEAAGDEDAQVNEHQDRFDRALEDAAQQADPVPGAVVDAAKQAFRRRQPVTDTAASSPDDDETGDTSAASGSETDTYLAS